MAIQTVLKINEIQIKTSSGGEVNYMNQKAKSVWKMYTVLHYIVNFNPSILY
jgi:hypothetical protein